MHKRRLTACLTALLLAGCSSSPGPGTLTVNGTVVDIAGHVSAGQTVLLTSGTFAETQVTDSEGTFSMAGVPTPYTATVLDSGGTVAISYVGLSLPEPMLTDPILTAPNRTGGVSGKLLGGSYPEPAQASTSFLFASEDVVASLADPGVASYADEVAWAGPAATVGTLYALQVENGVGGAPPTGYLGYGALQNVFLQDTLDVTGQDVTLTSVPTGTVSGTVTAPSGYTLGVQTLQLLVNPQLALPIYENAVSPEATFSDLAPSIPNTQVLVSATVSGPDGESVLIQAAVTAATPTLTLGFPPAPALTAPADGATAVTGTTPFSWTGLPGGVYLLQVQSGPSLAMVVTADTTATLGSLASGLGGSYTWGVVEYASVSSVDGLAALGGLSALDFANGLKASSATRTFSLGP